MNKFLSNKLAVITFLLPAILVYLLTVFLPLIWSLGYSFYSWNGLTEMKFIGLENYGKLFFNDSVFWKTLWNTLKFTVLNTFIQIFLGLIMAILLTYIRRSRELFQTIYFTPVIISTVAIAEIFSNIYSVNPVGLLNYVLGLINEDWYTIEWLTNPNLSLLSGTIAEGYRYAGVYMVIFYAALIAIPEEIIEAAKIDGASGWNLYKWIKLPLIKPVFITCVVLVLNGSLKAFDVPYLLTQGGPGTSSELTITYMYKEAFSSLSYGYGSAIAVFIALLSFLIIILIFLFTRRKGD
ncbi:carbohydrate ABC transporter permease [Gracilibacillus massiliensis]|uniref:carbohydrate ABC transporter permease n=1 Tax=Gracilibacillus massiliensis TaxID=1564956 RepID=UPI00071DCADA|nr:sugar ABC transporter permease [Gracilibacillus massiliensis]